jgi:hypothetical protein
MGDVRQAIDIAKLEGYLKTKAPGIQLPLKIKQVRLIPPDEDLKLKVPSSDSGIQTLLIA